MHGGRRVVERDPREPVAAVADPASEPEPERQQEPWQKRLEHDPEPQVDDPDARLGGRGVAASQASQTDARKSSPCALSSVSTSSPREP